MGFNINRLTNVFKRNVTIPVTSGSVHVSEYEEVPIIKIIRTGKK